MSNREILLFDGSYYVHRSAYRAKQWIKPEQFESHKAYFDAILGKTLEVTIQSLAIAIENYNPILAIMTLDYGVDTLISSQKVVEEETDDHYSIVNSARHKLVGICHALNIPCAGRCGYEADDYGYLLSQRSMHWYVETFKLQAHPESLSLRMLTHDKDWYQNITEKCIWTSAQSGELVTHEDMVSTYDVNSGTHWRYSYVSEQAMIRSKDGNTGVDGVGPAKVVDILPWIEYTTDEESRQIVPESLPSDTANANLVRSQWDRFLKNWNNISGDWIFASEDPDSGMRCDCAMIIQLVQDYQEVLEIIKSNPNAQLQWASKVASHCGEKPKLGAAMRRFHAWMEANEPLMGVA